MRRMNNEGVIKTRSRVSREITQEEYRIFGCNYLYVNLFCNLIYWYKVVWVENKWSCSRIFVRIIFSLCSVFVIFLFKNRQTMKNPEKLRQERIVKTDERNIEISAKSLQITTFVMVISLAILSIVGSFISRTLMTTASGLLNLFLISYIISYFSTKRNYKHSVIYPFFKESGFNNKKEWENVRG